MLWAKQLAAMVKKKNGQTDMTATNTGGTSGASMASMITW